MLRNTANRVKDDEKYPQTQTANSFRILEQELRNFWGRPADRTQTLLAFQELCRVSLALHLLAAVSKNAAVTSQSRLLPASEMLQNVQDFAKMVLEMLSDVIIQGEQVSLA